MTSASSFLDLTYLSYRSSLSYDGRCFPCLYTPATLVP